MDLMTKTSPEQAVLLRSEICSRFSPAKFKGQSWNIQGTGQRALGLLENSSTNSFSQGYLFSIRVDNNSRAGVCPSVLCR